MPEFREPLKSVYEEVHAMARQERSEGLHNFVFDQRAKWSEMLKPMSTEEIGSAIAELGRQREVALQVWGTIVTHNTYPAFSPSPPPALEALSALSYLLESEYKARLLGELWQKFYSEWESGKDDSGSAVGQS